MGSEMCIRDRRGRERARGAGGLGSPRLPLPSSLSPPMLRIGVEELSWRGRLTRTLEVGPSHLCALDGRGERCSTWPLAELIEIGREADRLWMVVPGLCGACSRKVTYATGSEKECEALVALLRTARQRPGGSGAFVAAMRDAMSAA